LSLFSPSCLFLAPLIGQLGSTYIILTSFIP
jgi:hypothetical protein